MGYSRRSAFHPPVYGNPFRDSRRPAVEELKSKWLSYEFEVAPLADAGWNEVPGVYIFCRSSGLFGWSMLYVGETNSLHRRLTASHEQWLAGLRMGMTNVHALLVRDETVRLQIEKELIQAFDPPLNKRNRSQTFADLLLTSSFRPSPKTT